MKSWEWPGDEATCNVHVISLDMLSYHQEEQFRLKQELANLAITLNMEAQKRRHLEVDNNRQNNKAERKDIQVIYMTVFVN